MDSAMILRQYYSHKRSNLSTEKEQRLSQQINQHIMQSLLYQNAKSIGLYYPVQKEVSLIPTWDHAYKTHKKTFFPLIEATGILSFYPLTPTDSSTKNKYGIPEPASQPQAYALQDIDLLLTPLLAFDKRGTRLGHGKGYYDKTLAQHKPHFILGVAYAFQEHDSLPRNSWDIPLDGIVTEQGMLLINKSSF